VLPIPPRSPDQIKIANEITTYEMLCFYLGQLDFWLYHQKHPDHKYILTFMIEYLVSLAGQAFSLSKDALRKQIYNRVGYYPSLDGFEQITEAIAHQIVWGIEKKKPSDTIPPEIFNALSFEAAPIAKRLKIEIEHELPVFHQSWSNTLLNPVCFKETI
jgi:hypothetical protein